MDFGHNITGIYFVSPPCTNNKHSYYVLSNRVGLAQLVACPPLAR